MKKTMLYLGALLVLIIISLAVVGRRYAPINDISTTRDASLKFVYIAAQNKRGDYSYNETFSEKQKQYYPDIRPLVVERNSSELFSAAEQLAQELGWELLLADAQKLRIEAVVRTPLLRFKDDVVIVMVPLADSRTLVQMRSKSRLGKADFGANAKRIRNFLSEFLRKIYSVEESR